MLLFSFTAFQDLDARSRPLFQGAFHALRPEDLRRRREIFLAYWRENWFEQIKDHSNFI